MKRRLFKLAVFLLLGAILNVAVAWGCATWSLSAGVRRVDVPWHLLNGDRRDFSAAMEKVGISCGWPRLCLFRRLTEIESKGHGWDPGSNTEYGLVVAPRIWEVLGGQTWPQGRLPIRPIWPGFAINTVFYAAILWLLWLSPFVVRRVIRRKRGHCINCGYDLRGAEHEVCPECGASTKRVEVA